MKSGAFSYIFILIFLLTTTLLFCQRNRSIRIAKSNYIKAIETKVYLYPDKSADLLTHHTVSQRINNHDVVHPDRYEDIQKKRWKHLYRTEYSFYSAYYSK